MKKYVVLIDYLHVSNCFCELSICCVGLHTLHRLQLVIQHLSQQSAQIHEEVYGAN